MSETKKFFFCFGFLYFFVTLGSAFLHQVGHGVGALADGVRISTGVAMAGDYDKSPKQEDFRQELILPGRVTSGGLLGPFINWALAIGFSMFLLAQQQKMRWGTLFVITMIISNSWIRIFPFLRFMYSHIKGPLFLDDEATWAMATIPGYSWPADYNTLQQISAFKPELITSNPWSYFWPAISMIICCSCLVIATRKAYSFYGNILSSQLNKIIFLSIPIVMGPLILTVALFLDIYLRINWG